MKKVLAGFLLMGTMCLASTVYITPKGKKYHSTKSCRTLRRSRVINAIDSSDVGNRKACKVCH